jgi:hypothetical protein
MRGGPRREQRSDPWFVQIPEAGYLFVATLCGSSFSLSRRVWFVRWHTGGEDFWENGYTFFFALIQSIAAGSGGFDRRRPCDEFRVPLYPMFLVAATLGHQAFLPVLLAQSAPGQYCVPH